MVRGPFGGGRPFAQSNVMANLTLTDNDDVPLQIQSEIEARIRQKTQANEYHREMRVDVRPPDIQPGWPTDEVEIYTHVNGLSQWHIEMMIDTVNTVYLENNSDENTVPQVEDWRIGTY